MHQNILIWKDIIVTIGNNYTIGLVGYHNYNYNCIVVSVIVKIVHNCIIVL